VYSTFLGEDFSFGEVPQSVVDQTDTLVWPVSQWKRVALFVQCQLDVLYEHSIPFAIRHAFKKGLEVEEDGNDGDDNDGDDGDDDAGGDDGDDGGEEDADEQEGGLVLREVEAEDGETMKDICSRVGADYSPGCGFYLLSKKEKVSKDKQLVVWLTQQKKEHSRDGNWIRSQIGVSASAKAVDITPSAQKSFHSIGGQLFVNSTSATRRFKEGDKVLVLTKGAEKEEKEKKRNKSNEKTDITDEIVVRRSRLMNAIAVEVILQTGHSPEEYPASLKEIKALSGSKKTTCFDSSNSSSDFWT